MTLDEWIEQEPGAAVPAPPVEKKLAPGWMRYTGKPSYERCWRCTGRMAVYARDEACKDRMCEVCAVPAGAFASPEPKAEAAKPVTVVIDECQGSDSDDTLFAMHYAFANSRQAGKTEAAKRIVMRWPETPKPTPVVEKPRPLTCSWCDGAELVALRRTGRHRASVYAVCQRCYLREESKMADLMVNGDRLLGDPKPRSAAHPGVSPVVFGLGVGIWASRGMTVKR